MASFDVYSTDANPRHIYAEDGDSNEAADWVDQLARVSTGPVDLFVDVPDTRVVWTFRAARQGTSSRTNRYLADYQADGEATHDDLFGGLYTNLSKLPATGAWEFPDDTDQRWTAGFDLPSVEENCPGLTADETDALTRVVSGDWPQVVLGMSSYPAALQTLKHLTARGVDGTIAINSHGATPETEGIDLVLWPNAEQDFQPVTVETQDVLARAGFRREADMTVADETPSESAVEVKYQRETESPLETFVGDTVGRIGAGLTVFFTAATFGALLSIEPLHPLSGLSAIGGILGAALGLVTTQQFVGTTVSTDGGMVTTSDGTESTDLAAVGPMLSTMDWEWQQYAAFTGYWLTLAYAFPTIFRLADWPFGATITLGATVPSVLTYTGAFFGVSLIVYGIWTIRADVTNHLINVGSLIALYTLFMAGLIVSNGLACEIWYGLIGFTGACP